MGFDMASEFIKDKQLPGLYKRARASGYVWVVKAKQRGVNKLVTITLGRGDVISLQQARRMAIGKLLLLSKGIQSGFWPEESEDSNSATQTIRNLFIYFYLLLYELDGALELTKQHNKHKI
jgi:hypothetical protein